MQMVRESLGEDAIIVATREEKGGKTVRVTAAIDPGYGSPAFEVGRSSDEDGGWLQYDVEDEENAVTEEITEAMLRHGVPEDVMDHVISCATVIGLEQPGVALIAALEHLFGFTPLPQKTFNKPIALIGPPGAGKTLAAAKLAARGVMAGHTVGVISTDTVRAGGIEQLQSFTKLLQIDLKKAKNEKELVSHIGALSHCDQLIIDTQGVNPFNRDDLRASAIYLGAADIEPVLVLQSGLDADESGEIARAFASLGANLLMPSRIDMARRLGGLLSAAHHGSLSFTDAGHSPKVAEGLFQLSPKTLSRLLMPGSYTTESASSQKSGHSSRQSATSPATNNKRTRLKT